MSHNPPLGSMSFEAALTAAAAAATAVSMLDPKVLASSIVSSSSVSSSSSSDACARSVEDLDWLKTTVDKFSYMRVRDTMQEKWIAFAYGEEPWTAWSGRHETHSSSQAQQTQSDHSLDPHMPGFAVSSGGNNHVLPTPTTKAEKVFVFGPEGEIGKRGSAICDGRRRRSMWREVLEPLGWALVEKLRRSDINQRS